MNFDQDFKKIRVNTTALMYELYCEGSIVLGEICEFISVSDSTSLTMLDLMLDLSEELKGIVCSSHFGAQRNSKTAITILIDIIVAYGKFSPIPKLQTVYQNGNIENRLSVDPNSNDRTAQILSIASQPDCGNIVVCSNRFIYEYKHHLWYFD